MKILIVDDQRSNRDLLRWILEDSGMFCAEAENGEEAIRQFNVFEPDIVLMDVMMPVMDGYEATRRIKELAGEKHVPVIFLTAMSDNKALTKCLEAGGDDFLSKPIDEVVLQAKIKAHTRTQLLNQQLNAKNQELTYLHNRLKQEHMMGEHVLSNAMKDNLLDVENVRTYLSPMSLFNGDIFLIAPKPSGGIYVLLGDFTGHGLAASIGAVPVSQVFFAMAKKNLPVSEIATSVNRTLTRFLPDTMFCAATIVEFNKSASQMVVWAGGLPDGYLVDPQGGIVGKIESQHMPLGVLDDDEFEPDVQLIRLRPNQRVLLYTDGIIEAKNAKGEMYGVERLERVLQQPVNTGLIESVNKDCQRFNGDSSQDDDISIVEIISSPFPEFVVESNSAGKETIPWSISTKLQKNDLIRVADPVRRLVALLPEDSPLCPDKDLIYTVVKELFINALDHGILALDSDLKGDSDQGFFEYYQIREERLRQMNESHWIRILMDYFSSEKEPSVRIVVQNTGKGFDYEQALSALQQDDASFGRGLMLVNELCSSVRFSDEGRTVEAIYRASLGQA